MFEVEDRVRWMVDGRRGKIYSKSFKEGYCNVIWLQDNGDYGIFVSKIKETEIEKINKEECVIKEEFLKVLIKLNKAFSEAEEVFAKDTNGILNDSDFMKDYPFSKSFDEVALDVNNWFTKSIEEFNK